MILQAIRAEVKRLSNPSKATQFTRFFKTGIGQYGEGQFFVGLSNPQSREIAKNHRSITIEQIQELIQSKIHEQRFIALVLMDYKYKKGNENQKLNIYDLYLRRMNHVDCWDLVDLSAPNIVGEHLLAQEKAKELQEAQNGPCEILYKWAQSANLWYRRISILSTLTFIRANRFQHTIRLSEKLLGDKQDLMHKAVGWMLRQTGKRNRLLLESFLQKHYENIPRTALRYSIEKFQEPKRQAYLKGIFKKNENR